MLRVKPPSSAVRLLDERDRGAVLAICDRDPVTNVFVSSRVRALGLEPGRLGAQMWGHGPGGRLQSLCYAGANLVPVAATPDAVVAFADRALKQGRRCSSVVGPADEVQALWALLRPRWGPARDVRPVQPVMVINGPPQVAPDPLVRRGLVPGPPGTADPQRPRLRPDRGRPGDLQGRDRGRDPAGLPGPGRLGPAGMPRPGAGRPRHGRGRGRGGPGDLPGGLAVRPRLQ